MGNDQEDNIGELYQEKTKYFRGKMSRRSIDWSQMPETFKIYPDAKTISLPPPAFKRKKLLDQILRERRSYRAFSSKPLLLDEVSTLLWATQGITDKKEGFYFRTSPSAGALYPIETYLCVNNVHGLDSGVYHYAVKDHFLEQLSLADYGEQIAKACLGQKMMRKGGVVFVWTALVERSTFKYQQRAYRYFYLEAGHIGQNLSLAAEELGLGCCMVAAFFDEEINSLLEIDGKHETVLYLGVVGKKKALKW